MLFHIAYYSIEFHFFCITLQICTHTRNDKSNKYGE